MLQKSGPKWNVLKPTPNGEEYAIAAQVYESRRLAVLCDHANEMWNALRGLIGCPDLNVDELDGLTVVAMDRACQLEKKVLTELNRGGHD